MKSIYNFYFNIDALEDAIKYGDYGVPVYHFNGSYDPQTSMPEYDLELRVFENYKEAEAYRDKNHLLQAYSNDSAEIFDLNKILKSKIDFRTELEERRKKEEKLREKRREKAANTPMWKKKRSYAKSCLTSLNEAKKKCDKLQREYNDAIKKLETELNKAGIKYNSIDEVLSRNFLS